MNSSIEGMPTRWPEQVVSPDLPVDDRRVEPARPSGDPTPSSFQRLLEGLGGSIEKGERIIAGAARGYTNLDAAELIALQAGIYRYSEAIELAAKLVDRATSAVRTVLQGGH